MAEDEQIWSTYSQTVKQAIQLDKANGNTRWWDAILQEMKKIRPAFKVFKGRKEDLPIGYQMIKCHMIFDVKLDENFKKKDEANGRRPYDYCTHVHYLLVSSAA